MKMLQATLNVLILIQVHMSDPNVEQFIDLLLSLPAEGHHNSFAYLMFEWTKMQGKWMLTGDFSKCLKKHVDELPEYGY